MSRVLILCFLGALCRAQSDPIPTDSTWVVRDFRFNSGDQLPELKVHYLTFGKPERDAAGHVRNAVLILHGTASSSAPFLSSAFLGALFLEGQALDAGKYFLILPDAIGHGDSSKPSDGLHAKFPPYDYNDMVRAQYRLVREHLGIDHLRLVMGAEMGGMQTWLWGEQYPDFMDALLPLGSAPAQIAGRNRIYRDMVIDSIRSDPAWNGGEYTSPPRGLLAAQFAIYLMTQSPLQLHRFAPTGDIADAQFQAWRRRALRLADANDLLYQFNASRNYDPDPQLANIRASLLAINFADDELNPPELGVMEREIRQIPGGRYVLIPASEETRGSGTALRARVWRDYLAELLRISGQG
jgi:homoserine O-acetyltransferase/O-succinyltransferase